MTLFWPILCATKVKSFTHLSTCYVPILVDSDRCSGKGNSS